MYWASKVVVGLVRWLSLTKIITLSARGCQGQLGILVGNLVHVVKLPIPSQSNNLGHPLGCPSLSGHSPLSNTNTNNVGMELFQFPITIFEQPLLTINDS